MGYVGKNDVIIVIITKQLTFFNTLKRQIEELTQTLVIFY